MGMPRVPRTWGPGKPLPQSRYSPTSESRRAIVVAPASDTKPTPRPNHAGHNGRAYQRMRNAAMMLESSTGPAYPHRTSRSAASAARNAAKVA